MMEEWNDGMME